MNVIENGPDNFTIELAKDEESKVKILATDNNKSKAEIIKQLLTFDLTRMTRLPG